MPFKTLPSFRKDSVNRNACAVCSRPKHARYVDSPIFRGPFIEREGYFDVCPKCITDAAKVLGMIPKTEADRLIEQGKRVDDAEAEYASIYLDHQELLGQLEEVVKNYNGPTEAEAVDELLGPDKDAFARVAEAETAAV